LLKLFARYHAIDIYIKFCVGNTSSVTIWLQTGSGMAKLPLFSRNLQKIVSFYESFSWAPPSNQNENDTYKYSLHSHITVHTFSFWFKGGTQENYLHKDTNFCRFLLKRGNFAIPLPVYSHIVMLELFPTQNFIWISIVGCLAKRLIKVLSVKFTPILQGHIMQFWL
jgi:hypothetical protein